MASLEAAAIGAGARSGCVQSLVRALSLLDQLAAHREGLSLTEIARRVALPRSTAHRLLTTMESMRYVAFDAGRGHWMVGLRAVAFAGGAAEVDDLAGLAGPFLRSLQTAARATASLSVLDALTLRRLAQARLAGESSLVGRVGDRLPLHTSAAGKAVLAALPDKARDAYLAQATLEARTAASMTAQNAPLGEGTPQARIRRAQARQSGSRP